MGKGGAFNVTIKGGKRLSKILMEIPKKGEEVIESTMSDFRSRGPGWIKQGVQQHYHVDNKAIKDAGLKVRTDSGGAPGTINGVSLVYKGHPLTLTHFNQSPRSPKWKRAKRDRRLIPGQRTSANRPVVYARHPADYRVSANIKRPVTYSRSTFITSSNGATIPFQRQADRTGNNHHPYPIKPVKTVSVPQMIANDAKDTIEERINSEIGKRFEHHCKRKLGL